jgi:hypothetical protein
MRPVIKLSQAWLDAHGWSLAEGAALLELDWASAVPSGANDSCPNPKCGLPNTEYQGWVFEPDSATANSENEHGRANVLCICGTMYWYATVDVLAAPTDEARIRAASAPRAITPPEPPAGRFLTDGGVPYRAGYTPDASRIIPPVRSELPPGAGNTLDTAIQVVRITHEHRQRQYNAATSFITPPFGPIKAREPLP